MAEDKFLARWSRRKRAAAQPMPPRARPPGEERLQDAAKQSASPADAPAPNTAPTLRPVEAIDGPADIREFLAEGVPTALARAALRRAWASDPAIRDFVGLAENAWDFNAPDQVPGFGTVSAEDVRRLLAHAEQPGPASAETPSHTAPAEEASPKEGTRDERAVQAEPLGEVNQSAVAQSAAPSPPSAPRHGGALPK